jgi:hypothetical protein
MANFDTTAMSAAMKEYYHGQKVIDLVFKKNPLLAMLKKDTKAGGKVIPVPLQYGVSQGRSATFATAQANQTAADLAEFMLTRKSDYSVATIDNQTMEATENDAEAFIKASKVFIDAAYKTITLSAASKLYRSGTGTIGVISAISSGVITLTDPTTANQFERGMVLTACQYDGTSAPGALAALGYVIAVDTVNGTVTVSATATGSAGDPSSWSTSYPYLVVQGDSNAAISGLQAWLPVSRPGSTDNFYGVNRSLHATRLAGVVQDFSDRSIEEALIDITNLQAEQGGSPGKVFTNYRSYGSLVKALGAKVQYVDLETDVGIGFRGVRLNGDDGELDVIPDRNCPGKMAFPLDMDTWTIRSVGDVPHIVTYGKEGLEMLRVSNQDAAEVRIAYYANLECNAPGWNGCVVLGA